MPVSDKRGPNHADCLLCVSPGDLKVALTPGNNYWTSLQPRTVRHAAEGSLGAQRGFQMNNGPATSTQFHAIPLPQASIRTSR